MQSMATLRTAMFATFALLAACSESGGANQPGASDASVTASTGGAMGTGAVASTGGSRASGGSSGAGGSGTGGARGSSTGGALTSGGTSSAGGGTASGGVASDGGVPFRLPPENAPFDYQLGGAYPPPTGVQIVSRDRTDAPAQGLYNICYLNGFQIQPGEEASWDADLILRDGTGAPVIDPDWNEALLDVSTPDKRGRIAAVVGGWIEQCATDGFDAVEIDNLDTYSRSGGRISQDDAVALLALLSGRAHAQGLAIAQKNSTEILSRKSEMGTDFAVAEECSRYSECADYISTYGAHVLMIEYRTADFTAGCQTYGSTHSIVRRDLNLVRSGSPGYVFDGC